MILRLNVKLQGKAVKIEIRDIEIKQKFTCR